MRRPRLAAVVTMMVIVAPSCASPPGPTLPTPPQVVDVEMKEYRVLLNPPTEPGRVVLRIRNTGRLRHDLVLVSLDEDVPPLREQLGGSTRRQANVVADIPPQPAAGRTALAVDLPPGRYGIVCFVLDPDGQQHSRKGMATEFRLGAT